MEVDTNSPHEFNAVLRQSVVERIAGAGCVASDRGGRRNCVWHTHLSRPFSGCWTAARNVAALRDFHWSTPSHYALAESMGLGGGGDAEGRWAQGLGRAETGGGGTLCLPHSGFF